MSKIMPHFTAFPEKCRSWDTKLGPPVSSRHPPMDATVHLGGPGGPSPTVTWYSCHLPGLLTVSFELGPTWSVALIIGLSSELPQEDKCS